MCVILKYVVLISASLLSVQATAAQSRTGNILSADVRVCDIITSATAFDIEFSAPQADCLFNDADTITMAEALRALCKPSRYYVRGTIACDETIDYYLFPSGTGIIMTEPIVFLRGTISIPDDTFTLYESGLRVLAYDKCSIDPDTMEQWQSDNEYGYLYREGGKVYERYENWKDIVFINEIHRAFELCEPTPRHPLNVLWNVDHYCKIYGLAIHNDKLCVLYMNGGGVIILRDTIEAEDQCFGCWDPEGKAFFTQILNEY